MDTHLTSLTDNLIVGGSSNTVGTVVLQADGTIIADSISTRASSLEGDKIELREDTDLGTGALAFSLGQANLPDGATRECLNSSGFINTECLDNSMRRSAIEASFTATSGAIQAGWQAIVRVPFNGTIDQAYISCMEIGSIVVDVWRDTIVNSPVTDSDSITGVSPITVSAAAFVEDTTLTGWRLRS